MIAVLEDRLNEINQSLIDSVYRSQHTPPPAPTAGQRRFLRVKATAVDTDGDNISDFEEFLLAAENNPFGNPFNADADGNGVPDDTQVDTDGDGQFNATDATPSDGTAAYATVPYARYALFEIPPGGFQINDQGTVLYGNQTWQGGTLLPLQGIGDGSGRANGINDSGLIVGQAGATAPDGGAYTAVCAWTNRSGSRGIYSNLTEGGSSFLVSYHDEGVYYGSSFLGPDGRFAGTRKDYEPGTVTSSQYIWTLSGDPLKLSSWAVPSVPNPTPEAGEPFIQHLISGFGANGLMWGAKAPNHDKGIVFAPHELPELPFIPDKVIRHDQPNGQTAFFALQNGGNARIHLNGSWQDSPAYANATDIAADGTAIGQSIAAVGTQGNPNYQAAKTAPILLNGKWVSLERSAPDLPAEWKDESPQLIDISPGGWILAKRTNPTTYEQKGGVMLPIRITGVAPDSTAPEATGVDDFSISATFPDPSVQDRIWIMAPFASESETQVSLNAPLNQATPLQLIADGIRFGSGSSFQLTDPTNTFNVIATSANAVGQEIPVTLRMGTSDSVGMPIGVKSMKARIINVVLWRIGSDRNPENVFPGSPNYESPIYPSFDPSPFELQAYLNKIFSPQINTLFHCEIRNAAVNFDTTDGVLYGAPANKSQPRNAYLDTTLSLERECTIIKNACNEQDTDINIYVLGATVFLRTGFWDPNKNLIVSKLFDGLSSRDERKCVIAGAGFRANSEILDTIAHEIGHILVGEGHPDQDDGVAPLPGTTHIKRLMCSGAVRKKDGSSSRIVKAEWDAAENWLQQQIDEPTP